ncbi:C40 family peptidase [Algibacter lectus]|uniref:Cell wall lytic activity n=1 Tax=Algibacter lectus TaxID=221126 RepID=A0A090WZT9_9FLAO|nr:C40 family peptidase [Algibacter lectus]MWW26854.1 NlpC/P60 family protein [Algibacter lectus]TDY64219.1 NlpC/P60 family protein [Algibacter lectus]GAL82640.1 cell wall lytic activity [Algibacter lectus]
MIKFFGKLLFTLVVLFTIINCKGPEATVANSNDDIVVSYDSLIVKTPYLPVQLEYAKLLNTKPDSLQNIKMYTFVDKWMNTPYLLGGETKEGIDCSSFTQLLFIEVYDKYIERTAQKQFDSEHIVKFRGKEFLEEGDFLFFNSPNEQQLITHVGIYLKNNKFINATSYRGPSGASGVKICDITNPFWEKRFVAGGKRTDLE